MVSDTNAHARFSGWSRRQRKVTGKLCSFRIPEKIPSWGPGTTTHDSVGQQRVGSGAWPPGKLSPSLEAVAVNSIKVMGPRGDTNHL